MAQPPDDAATAARRGYAICTTQRSGSNYLCQLLSSTGVLGRPLDYFNGRGRRDKGWTDYPDDREQQLAIITSHGATRNGVYGFKLFAHDFDTLGRLPWAARLPGLRWVYLHRGDLLGQAISLLLAKQTGRWRSTDEARNASLAYDADAIEREIAEIGRDDAHWRDYFARNGLEPLRLRYEDVAAAPDAAVRAVAALLEVDAPPNIDPTQVDLAVQRDDVNREWRARYLADRSNLAAFRPAVTADVRPVAPRRADDRSGPIWYPAIRRLRPRLTVSIVTRDSETRLPRLLAEAAGYADEIVVGVDATSSDGTFDLASRHADTVYRFRLQQPGQLAAVRMLALQYAKGDWILSLDDDEGMEPGFELLLPKLLAAEGVTHHHFRRKWVLTDTPPTYLHEPPWYPNWSRRMFRNDRSLVWKPAEPHSQYYVLGPGHYEHAASILHFEPVTASPEKRRAKIAHYRDAGAAEASERFYDYSAGERLKPVTLRDPVPLRARHASRIDAVAHDLATPLVPPWCAAVLGTDMPRTARAGSLVVVEVAVRNTGTLAWSPSYARWPTRDWPQIRLACHILRSDGTALPNDGSRTPVTMLVAPGAEVTLVHELRVPPEQGEYVIVWDMLNEQECWFADLGGSVVRSALLVV